MLKPSQRILKLSSQHLLSLALCKHRFPNVQGLQSLATGAMCCT